MDFFKNFIEILKENPVSYYSVLVSSSIFCLIFIYYIVNYLLHRNKQDTEQEILRPNIKIRIYVRKIGGGRRNL
ncbi:hypothetical protein [Enterococcus faecalis]|uniref:hypothetical protein n=1 Tax=Enterococcus faecalis TaxID=1351 RepID=UPI0034CDE39F